MEYLAQVQPAQETHFDMGEATVPCLLFCAGSVVQQEGLRHLDYLQF